MTSSYTEAGAFSGESSMRRGVTLAALMALAGCAPESQLTPAEAQSRFEYFSFEVESLESQLKRNPSVYWIDQGNKQLTRAEALDALAEARRELAAAKLALDEADLTADK